MTSATPPPPGPSPDSRPGPDRDDVPAHDDAAGAAWPQTPTDDPLDPPHPDDDAGTGSDAAAPNHGDAAGPAGDAPAPDQDDDATVDPVTTSGEGITADLWAFRFDDPVMAQEALLAAMRLQRRKRLELDDAAIVLRDERGRTRIVQTRELSTGQGALSGSWLGLLAGLFVPPAGALVGMALGAAAGGLFAKLRDKGINDDEMKQWGEQLSDGQAALFLLVEDCHRMRALHEVSRFPATVLTSTGPADVVEAVTERLAVDPWGP